jgi:hypothetical protein
LTESFLHPKVSFIPSLNGDELQRQSHLSGLGEELKKNLSDFIDGTLDWLSANLDFFALPSKEDDEKAGEVTLEWKRKAFGELALACMLMHRHPKVKVSQQFHKILNYVDCNARIPEYSFHMMRRPNLFPLYMVVLVGLEACGRKLPEHRVALQRILDFEFMDAIERTPWSQIDFKYFLDCAGLRHNFPDYEALYRLSSVYRLPPIPHLRNIDVYALTHIIFFLGDFGQRDLRPILAERFERTCEEVTLLLGAYTHKQDWDIVGELLICCLCLQHRPAPLFELAWEGLYQAQTSSGDIPGRHFDPEGNQFPDLQAANNYRCKSNYHPTLVALFAAMLEQQVEMENSKRTVEL